MWNFSGALALIVDIEPYGILFLSSEEVVIFFINNSGFKKWNFMALLGEFKGILIWDQYSKEPPLL